MAHALLMTDVVDSTRLSEQLGDAAIASLWERHDRVARDLLRTHRGREIDKTDGFLLLFDRAADAVAYAVAYHRALGPLGIGARAGLHVGAVILRENAPDDVARGAKPLEVEGLAKPLAARVMSVAGAGQTLVTADAVAALGETPLRVESHGHWRMKGVSEPLELFEIGGADAPFTPPADGVKVYRVVRQGDLWLPVREVRHGLPAERDAFVGRDDDLQALARWVDSGARLVSVLGIGGTGKTRLVTRFAWTWLGDFPGGAWFCDLSEARAVDGIVTAVARALEVPLAARDPVGQLGHAIASRGRCLVVLDNFEQVARHAEETVSAWLDRAPDAVFVVTTREILGLPGEAALALSPLLIDDGVALFVARAMQAKRDFTLTDAERPQVLALVRLLDQLPLAIELAAARVRVMPPKLLLQRMSERFKLLASAGGRQTRQSTLRAALDWSWDLLSPEERGGLAQISVFEGGFTLEAAEAVLAVGDAWPMDVVQALVDKSLVRAVSDERFDVLVTVQEYGAERLAERGEVADTRARHAAFYAELGQKSVDPSKRAAFEELDNLGAATRWASEAGDGALAVGALRGVWRIVELRGPVAMILGLCAAVLGAGGLEPREHARVLVLQGAAQSQLGRRAESRASNAQALAIAQQAGERLAEATAVRHLAVLDIHERRWDAAAEQLGTVLAMARDLGDVRLEARVHGDLGTIHDYCGRLAEARAAFADAIAAARQVGDRRTEGIALGNLAVSWLEEDLDTAHALFLDARALHVATADRAFEAQVDGNLGIVYAKRGEIDAAFDALNRALAVHREVGSRGFEMNVTANIGFLYDQAGRPDEATPWFEAADRILEGFGDTFSRARLRGDRARSALARGDREAALALVAGVEGLVHGAAAPDVAERIRAVVDAVRAEIDAG